MVTKPSVRIYVNDERQRKYKQTAKVQGLTLSDWGRRELDAAVEREEALHNKPGLHNK